MSQSSNGGSSGQLGVIVAEGIGSVGLLERPRVGSAHEGNMVDLAIGSEHEDFVERRGGDVKPEHWTRGRIGGTHRIRDPIEQLELTVERVEEEARELIRVTTESGRRRGRRLIRVHREA